MRNFRNNESCGDDVERQQSTRKVMYAVKSLEFAARTVVCSAVAATSCRLLFIGQLMVFAVFAHFLMLFYRLPWQR